MLLQLVGDSGLYISASMLMTVAEMILVVGTLRRYLIELPRNNLICLLSKLVTLWCAKGTVFQLLYVASGPDEKNPHFLKENRDFCIRLLRIFRISDVLCCQPFSRNGIPAQDEVLLQPPYHSMLFSSNTSTDHAVLS